MKDIDKELDNTLDSKLDNMKKQISEYKLSDEFKANLKIKLDKEYEEVNKQKITNKLNFFPRQLVTALACLVVIFSTCAFADGIGNYISKFLSNTDKELQESIENGKVQNVDMDFIKTDDLSIRVSQLVVEDNNLYIVFDVLTEEEWDRIYIDEMKIHDENGKIIFDSEKEMLSEVYVNTSINHIMPKEFLIIKEIQFIDDGIKENINRINITVGKVKLKNENKIQKIDSKMETQIEINKNLLD